VPYYTPLALRDATMNNIDNDPMGDSERVENTKQELRMEADKARVSLAGELWYLVCNERKWWLVPLLLSVALVAVAVFMTSSAAAPFIYTLF